MLQPSRRQLAQHDEQLLHRLRRQHRGRLVEDQQLRVGEQRADDLHPLHLAHRQRVHRPRGSMSQAVLGGLGRDAARHLGQRQARVQAEPDVLGHRQRVEQAEVLEHHADAQRARLLRVAHVHRLAVPSHAAFVGLDRAVDDLHQRRLAGAVLAQHRVGLARLHGQRDVVVGHHRRVALGDALQLQAGRRGHALPPSAAGAATALTRSRSQRAAAEAWRALVPQLVVRQRREGHGQAQDARPAAGRR